MERLRKNKDFRRVYSRGKSYATYNLVLYKNTNEMDINRVGFSISKKIGKAVVRNKIKRRLKEIVRFKKIDIKGYDLVFIARKPIIKLNYDQLERDVVKLFKKAALWTGK